LGDDARRRAGTVEVDVGIQVLAMKLVHRCGVAGVDLPIADIFACDRSVLAFD
jgi:hypothetical protein